MRLITLKLFESRVLRSSTHSLTSPLDGGEWSASRPGRFTPRERAPGAHWVGDCVGPWAGLDTVSRKKIPIPRRESNPEHPIVQLVASRYTDWTIPALKCIDFLSDMESEYGDVLCYKEVRWLSQPDMWYKVKILNCFWKWKGSTFISFVTTTGCVTLCFALTSLDAWMNEWMDGLT
jgi:hypothetical protein